MRFWFSIFVVNLFFLSFKGLGIFVFNLFFLSFKGLGNCFMRFWILFLLSYKTDFNTLLCCYTQNFLFLLFAEANMIYLLSRRCWLLVFGQHLLLFSPEWSIGRFISFILLLLTFLQFNPPHQQWLWYTTSTN
jgi:hypothetical protein